MKPADHDRSQYNVWALPHPLIISYVVAPPLAFNELILGQRMPKVLLIEKKSERPLVQRQWVPCPDCGAMNDGRLWAKGNALGHWFGYVCPVCAGRIPCHWNIFSILILAISFPIWMPIRRLVEEKWLRYELSRVRRAQEGPLVEAKLVTCLLVGTFFWGGFMWVMMSLLWLLIGQLSWRFVLLQLPVWLTAGFLWGLAMYLLMNRRGKPSKTENRTR